ncbi:hypothetical protein GCM10009557_85270 [Virgisporangium ochraceum]|uniref:Uncharacterized protein n=1 Tax=Virgisporangium ochraceum TaxID=65505 RepID=A0A8J4A6V6_9ACTN|nr:hypothetical protein [Virgisporangium ochraceum]GIJ73926.1 hypothetical protein Voc01_088430 [Virgisporangium ochraceum]
MGWYPMAAAAPLAEGGASSLGAGLKVDPPPDLVDSDVPAPDDLDTWQWDQYQLETDVAAKLGLTVGGGGSLARKSRVLVAEFSRSKSVARPEGQWRYGVAARLVVNVSNFNSGANMTLPFVAAEAQFNRLEASAALRVEGYVGADAAKQFPNFGAFDVETYVKLMDALSSLKDSIGSDVGNIRPVRLWTWAESADSTPAVDDRLTHAVGTVWALTQIAAGKPVTEAVAGYRDTDDDVAHAAIRETYASISSTDDSVDPDAQSRAHARDLLDGYRAKSGWFAR